MRNFPDKYEAILWSIALPGFGQFLNGKIVKGIVFIFLEFTVNMKSRFNEAILLSFNGEIEKAIAITDYQWLMFYPCLYMFAMWDAYRDAPGSDPRLYFPFVFCAYFLTVGLMFSHKLTLFGSLIGPVWLPILFLIPALFVGFFLKWIVLKMGMQRAYK